MKITLSSCCHAPLSVGGKGSTHWYECSMCGFPDGGTSVIDPPSPSPKMEVWTPEKAKAFNEFQDEIRKDLGWDHTGAALSPADEKDLSKDLSNDMIDAKKGELPVESQDNRSECFKYLKTVFPNFKSKFDDDETLKPS